MKGDFLWKDYEYNSKLKAMLNGVMSANSAKLHNGLITGQSQQGCRSNPNPLSI